jgi:hypothetical protein
MIIRREQHATLTAVSNEIAVNQAVAHLENYDTLLASAAGTDGLREVVRIGFNKAERYGWTASNHVQLYLELLMSFGSAFDTDPQYGWLRRYLDPAEGSAATRCSLLHFHAVAYLDRAFGEQGELGLAALERAETLTLDRLHRVGESLSHQAQGLVSYLHAERLDYLEPGVLDELVESAKLAANQFGLGMPAGAALLLVLQFLFGHRVHEDPVHPWLRRMLESPLEGEAKLEQIATKSSVYVKLMRRRLSERNG